MRRPACFVVMPAGACLGLALLAADLLAAVPSPDAEVIESDVRITCNERVVVEHLVRMKLLSARGVREHGTVRIVTPHRVEVQDVSGRTLRADGTEVALDPSAIFREPLVTVGRRDAHATSFALPGAEPGAILEYRWKERYPRFVPDFLRLGIDQSVPVRSVTWHVILPERAKEEIRAQAFRCRPVLARDADGALSVKLTDVPAWREAPLTPPEVDMHARVLLYEADRKRPTPSSRYWTSRGEALADVGQRCFAKPSDALRKQALDAIAGATTLEDKLSKLHAAARRSVERSSRDADWDIDVDFLKWLPYACDADALAKPADDATGVNLRFAALAAAAGIDARLALASDRRDGAFDPELLAPCFLRTVLVAVRMGDAWRLFDPASLAVPFGMLSWENEGQDVLVADRAGGVLVKTPITPPEDSLLRRTATLVLDERGDLSGDVHLVATGHEAVALRTLLQPWTGTIHVDRLQDQLESDLEGVKVTELAVQRAQEADAAVEATFKVRARAYATRTERRMVVAPSFFHRWDGAPPDSLEGTSPWPFEHARRHEDEVTIALPAGFAIEAAPEPAHAAVRDRARLEAVVGTQVEPTRLVFKRTVVFGSAGSTSWPDEDRAALPAFFGAVHDADAGLVAMTRPDAGGTAP